MTWLLLDVASYQGSLSATDVARAGFDAVNLKTSHGVGQKSVHPDITGWVTRAGAAGLKITTFHWLAAGIPGSAQAVYAWERLGALGLGGAGHTVDVEEAGVTQAVVTDYLTTMAALSGRPCLLYSADWYWTKGWRVDGLAPSLWAAPNAGYPGRYPGDTSPLWAAGYGGWNTLAVMQYAVEPLTFPDGTTGSIKVSKSAVRDPAVWTALTGGTPMAGWTLVPCLVTLRGEFNELSPDRDRASDGSVGDLAHQKEGSGSDHNPDETGRTPYSDADHINEVHAIDVDKTGPWPMPFDTIVDTVRLRHLRGEDDRLQYIIWNKRIASRTWGWTWDTYTGSSPHTEHAHFSSRYTTAQESDTRPWGVAELGDDMNLSDKLGDSGPTVGVALQAGYQRAGKAADNSAAALAKLDIVASKLDALAAKVERVDEEVWAKVPDPNISVMEKAALLRTVLGDDASAVGALLARP